MADFAKPFLLCMVSNLVIVHRKCCSAVSRRSTCSCGYMINIEDTTTIASKLPKNSK
jgi:hypothetical protein